MTKKLFIALFAITIATTVSAQQEEKNVITTWGVKAEANLSGFIVSGTSLVDSEMGFGGTGGGFVNIQLSEHFALQGELLYHFKSSQFDRQDIKGDYQYWGMEIPFYAVYLRELRNNGRIYAGIGPYAEFGFSAELKRNNEKIDLYEKDDATEVSAMNDFNSGFGVMLGYEFPCGIQLNVGYKISITNILDANSSSLTLLPNAVSIGVGYRFR